MESVQLRLVYVFTDLILPLAVGYVLRGKQWLGAEFCNKMIRFNVIVVYTLLSLLSFWELPLTFKLFWLPVFGLLLSVIPGAISYFFVARRYTNLLDRGSYITSTVASNIGTLGGVCAFILYGELGFAYTQMVSIPQTVTLFLFCFPVGQYYHAQYHNKNDGAIKTKLTFREMFLTWNQLPLVAICVGVFLHFSGIERPVILGTAFEWLVHVGAWTALLPVGFLINFSAARQYYLRLWDALLTRFIITPIIIFLLASYLFQDYQLLATVLVLSLTPTAVNSVVTAQLFQLNVDLSMASFIMTTALYLFIIYPLLYIYITNGYPL